MGAKPRARPRAAGQTRHVALLRGINVGGKNRIRMDELRAMFAAAACTDVETYIQSGNVVFAAPPAVLRRVAAHVSAEIHRRLGLRVPIVVRTGDELRRILAGTPFRGAGIEPHWRHIAFLSDAPAAPAIARLDPDRSPGDRFAVVGREVYLLLPNGVGRTKLTADYLDRTLGVTSTYRNWRTLEKLTELATT